MEYILTDHARKRMRERKITGDDIRSALENPTKIGYDKNGNVLIKKLYTRENKERLLILVGDKEGNHSFRIFTVIDTSKVKKYL